jgi:hypothetical protein
VGTLPPGNEFDRDHERQDNAPQGIAKDFTIGVDKLHRPV